MTTSNDSLASGAKVRMSTEPRLRVWIYQSVGFLAILTLIWLDHSMDLMSLVLGGNSFPSRATVQTLLVMAVWLLVSTSTRRVLEHMRRLERFMKLCAWCHRVEQGGEWMRLEQFLESGFDTPTSHGICPICLDRQKAEADRVKEARKQAMAQSPQPCA